MKSSHRLSKTGRNAVDNGLFLAAVAIAVCCKGQDTGPVTAKGTCIIANTGANTKISQTCNAVDPELFKQFQAIVEGTKKDSRLLRDVLAQLQSISNQLRQGGTPNVVNAPNGIGIAGGIVTNPTVNNNTFGVPQPPPGIKWVQKPVEPAPNNPIFEPLARNPGAAVTITVDGVFYTPAFALQCDRPCAATSISTSGVSTSRVYTTGYPNIAVAALTMPSFIDAQAQVFVEIRSLDPSPVQVTAVEPYVPSHRK